MQRSYNSSKHSNNSPIKKNMMVLIDTNCIFLQVESIAIYIYIIHCVDSPRTSSNGCSLGADLLSCGLQNASMKRKLVVG